METAQVTLSINHDGLRQCSLCAFCLAKELSSDGSQRQVTSRWRRYTCVVATAEWSTQLGKVCKIVHYVRLPRLSPYFIQLLASLLLYLHQHLSTEIKLLQ